MAQGELNPTEKVFVNELENEISNLYSNSLTGSVVSSGESVAFSLAAEVDVQVGSIVSSIPLEKFSAYSGSLIWFSEEPGIKSRSYLAILGSRRSRVTLTKIEGFSPSTLEKTGELRTIPVNAIAKAELVFELGIENLAEVGAPQFMRGVLVDQYSGETAGTFLLDFPLRRSRNIVEHQFLVSRSDREAMSGARGKVLWFTGLSGSGKSTVADLVAKRLFEKNIPNYNLDGDSLRHGLSRDLGFTEADRSENIRRTAEVSRLFADAGLVALVSLVSPMAADRESARAIVGTDDFVEVFVDTPLQICEQRDPKGLYKKARAGEIPNFTGINAPFETPLNPDVHLDGTRPAAELAEEILRILTL